MNSIITVHGIAKMFEEEKLIRSMDEYVVNYWSLERAVSEIFLKWELSGKYISLEGMKEDLGITDIRSRKSLDRIDVATYLKYVLNMIRLYEHEYPSDLGYGYDTWYENAKEKIDAIEKVAKRILGQLGFRVEPIPNTRYSLEVLENNAAASEAIKVVESSSVKHDIYRYNCVDVCNDPDSKQKILASLYKDFELRKEKLLNNPDNKTLGSVIKGVIKDMGNLFNNLDIRHNVTVSNNSMLDVGNMSSSDKIRLYDVCYQLYIAVVLFSGYVTERKRRRNDEDR